MFKQLILRQVIIVTVHLQCFNSFSATPSVLWHCWLGGRKGIRPVKNWVVGCWRGRLGWGADLHLAQQMPLPLTISCSIKSRLVLPFLVLPFWYLLTRVVPDRFQQSSKTGVCVCVCSPSVLWRCWLGGRKGIWPVKTERWDLAWLSVWGKVQICIWPSWCHCQSLSLAPVNPDWFYLPGFTFLVQAHLGSPRQNLYIVITLNLEHTKSAQEPVIRVGQCSRIKHTE